MSVLDVAVRVLHLPTRYYQLLVDVEHVIVPDCDNDDVDNLFSVPVALAKVYVDRV